MDYPEVIGVDAGSIAEKTGIVPGDRLISINGEKIKDVLDYHFFSADPEIIIRVLHIDGSEEDFCAENYYGEEIGIKLCYGKEGKTRQCRNKCIFCFIDQMPKGMRETLYVKDDDVRLSFLTGSYITLTNLSEMDIERIIYQHISPVNVSVHTVNPKLRVEMLKNKNAGNVYKLMKKLAKNGITMNCQIVLVRGVNDGKELDLTVKKLLALCPYVNSLSVVPVGLTKYREGLCELDAFSKEDCIEVIKQLEKWQKKAKKKHDINFVYASDEFYLKAELPLPEEENYDGYPQIENGVGMVTSFRAEVDQFLSELPPENADRKVGIFTGMAAFELMKETADKICKKYENVKVDVFAIKNEFFGESVTVSGLVCGKDIIKQMKGISLPEEIIMPDVMFKADEDIMLDDISVSQLEKELSVKIKITRTDGESTVSSILGI